MSEFIQLIYDVMPSAIMYVTPLLLAALGGLFSERSGIVNIALDGIMIVGAFVSVMTINTLEPTMGYSAVWVGILMAGIFGMLFSMLHAYASINLSADQVISGTALNMLAPAITIFLAKILTGSQNVSTVVSIKRVSYESVQSIPLIGDPLYNLFFNKMYITSYLAILVTILVWYILFKTKFGLRLRACGENPSAADSMGINVTLMRYIGVMASGFLAGIAGSLYIVTIAGEFTGTVAGMGFLALGALIFGKWKPFNVLGAAFFFGFMKTLGDVSSVNKTLMEFNIPMEIYSMLPYVMTIVALIIFSRNIVAPKAVGEPYDKGKR